MKEIKNFVVFNSQIKHGQMNSAKQFYPGLENDPAERKRLMIRNKILLGREIGFDRRNIFMANQKDQNHPYVPGTSYIVTPEDVVEYHDLYDYNVWADTVKLTRNTPGVIIGFNVSDSANVIAMNLKTQEATSTYCSGSHINQGVPFTIASHLGGNPEDIVVDISPFAYLLPLVGEEPTWIDNSFVWKDCIIQKDGILYVDQKNALIYQLVQSGIKMENIYVRENSLQNPNYYSSQRARLTQDPSQDGRFMHAVMFEREGQEIEYSESYIKKYSVREK